MSAEKVEKTINLSVLAPRPGARKKRKRLGIGEGSGNGKTCGKGQKGQTSRSGFSMPAGFEGGQMPIHRRLPKRGFTSRKKTFGVNRFQVLSLEDVLGFANKSGLTNITFQSLCEAGLINKNERAKLLAGEVVESKTAIAKLTVEVHAVSAAARAAIEQAGGAVQLIEA